MDLQMPGLWEYYELLETIESLPYHIQVRNYFYHKWRENQIDYDRARCHYHISGLRRIVYRTFHEMIEKNTVFQFKTIIVPITFSLHYKIMMLSSNKETSFSDSEIQAIMKHYTLFTEKAMILLTEFIYQYLIDDRKLLQKIKMYGNRPNSDPCISPITSLLTPLFGKEEAVAHFLKLIRSYVVFCIIGENNFVLKMKVKFLLDDDRYVGVNQDTFTLLCLFNELEMNYRWLVNNKNKLDTILTDNMTFFSYTVTINNIENIPNDADGINALKKIFDTIATSKFLTRKDIHRLILKFRDVHASVDTSCLENVNASITILCTHCSLDFIKSLPKCVKVEMDVNEDFVTRLMDDIPQNVVKIAFKTVVCDENMKIPDHIAKIKIEDCTFVTNKTLTLSRNCKSVEISNMTGKLIVPGVMMCYIGSSMNYGVSTFSLDIDEMEKKGNWKLYKARIHGNVKLNQNLETVCFSEVVVASQSIVVLNSGCKNLLIENSEGLFDLREHIGIVQLFDRKMIIDIVYERGHFYNVGRFSLFHFCFKETAKLSNIYQKIDLNNISMTKNTELIINKACKELLIYGCNMVINVHGVECLEFLNLYFRFDVENRIKFTGSKRVNHIRFSNICRNINSIVSILEDFEEIKYVEFDSRSLPTSEAVINEYHGKFMALLTSKEGFGDNLDLVSELLAMKDKESSIFVYEAYSIIVNSILQNILKMEVMNTVLKLEIAHIAINLDNCKSLSGLRNLKILRIHSKTITREFLYNLPSNLELLDITDLFINKINWTERYVIKPSIFIRPHKSLKILKVDLDFLYNVCSISVLMPFLEILEVQYTQSIKTYPPLWKKIKVRELFIRCCGVDQRHKTMVVPNESKMLLFIKNLKSHINFESLEYIAFILPDKHVLFDPKTLLVI